MKKKMPTNSPVLVDRIELWPLERLTTVERHARIHSDAQIEQIACSFDEYGFNNPILTDPNGRIIVGRARYLAARKRNLTQVPVIVLAHLSEVQQRSYRITDNQLALNATWDEEALRLELEALVAAAFSMDLLGFGEQELKRLLESPELRKGWTDEDSVPPVPAQAVSGRGDLWKMDDHRLLCGDATLPASLAQLLGTERAALCFTDFPYNANYKSKGRQILNDNLGKDFPVFLETSCKNILGVTDGAVYICMSSAELDALKRAFEAAGGHWSTFVIWAKDHFTLGWSDYKRMYEPILYGWKEGGKHHWCGDRNQGDVWSFPKPHVNNLHPTMKPVALIEKAITNSSLPDAIVLDPFAGSGSTLIACQKTGRQARLLELDPQYVDVIVGRWQEFTGREATLDGDGRSFREIASTKIQEPPQPVAA